MNEQAANQLFAKSNLKFLTSPQFDKVEYKNRHTVFYYDLHKNRFGRPSVKEIQTELVILLKQTGVQRDVIEDLLNSAPFFSDLGDNRKQELLNLISAKSYQSVLSQGEIERVKQVGAYRALEKAKGKELEEKKQHELEELNKKIEEKRQEYESIPSILDDEQVEEPDYKPEVEDIRPWWERFYLKGNPFPRKDGLSAIAEDLYEQVVTRTKPFQETLSGLNRNPDHLFNSGFLLAGGFGFGKTTFIDYLSHYLIYRDVIPIRITCTRCSADSSGFADSFFLRLRKQLYDEASKMVAVDKQQLSELELEDQDIELFRHILRKKHGVIVFLDDYHKFESHFSQIWEFLGTLQVLKDNLTRGGLKVGFVVSGLPSWKIELSRNSQLHGFLDGAPIEMPEITAELVSEMFNKRISAFCYEGTPRLIKTDFVQKLVREFEARVGFRDYITKIVNELTNNNYAIVDSPIELSADVLESIRQTFEADNVVSPSLKKLIYGSLFKRFTQEQVARSLELIVHIGMHGGIAELDKEFLENKFYFQVLRECGLVQKQRLGHTNSLKWGLNGRFKNLVYQIYQKHSLNLHDYLLKLFAYKAYNSSSKTPVATELAPEFVELKRFFAQPELNLPTGVSENINLALRLFEAVLLGESQVTPDDAQLQRAIQSLEAFSAALFALDTSALYFQKAKLTVLHEQWLQHPLNDESISEVFHRLTDYQREKTRQHRSLALKQYRDVNFLVADYLRALLRDQCMDEGVGLLYRPVAHSEDAIEMFRGIRELNYSAIREDHFRYVRSVTDHLELRFRAFFYLTGSLIFGTNYFEQCPSGIVSYAYKNLDTRDSFVLAENRFNGLTRAQYRSILTEGCALREETVKHLDLLWKQSDWEMFCSVFVEENINASHNQIDVYDNTQRARYMRYCRMAEELLAAINRMTANLLQDKVYIFCESTPTLADSFFRFSLRRDIKTEGAKHTVGEWPKALLANKSAADHVVSVDTYNRIVQQIEQKLAGSPNNVLRIDLLNLEYLTGHYRTSIVELMCVLAFRWHATSEWLMAPWFGASILIRRK